MKEKDNIVHDRERIIKALDGELSGLQSILEEYHASEIARILEQLPQQDREKIVHVLPVEVASEVISEMDEESHPEKIVNNLHHQLASDIVEELSADDAADIISQLPEEKQNRILESIPKEDAENIRKLLAFPDDTAGGLMTTDIIMLHYSLTKKEALEEVIRQSEEMEEFYNIYVVDDADRLIGTVSLKSLIKAKSNVKIDSLVDEDVIYVESHTDQEEVAKLLSQYNLTSIPVVNETMVLLGCVTFDDVIDVMEEETTEDILKISGVLEDEELSGNWKAAVKSRLPWLLVNLITAFLSGFVVFMFQDTIDKVTILAVFMPIVAGMGGNAGTQALAVTIRRISLNDLPDSKMISAVTKELLVGLFNGIIVGFAVMVVAMLKDQNPMLGLVVFMAMSGNLMIAGIAGSSIPILLEKMGIDPAVASSIFITALTDVIGFLLLLGLGSYLLL